MEADLLELCDRYEEHEIVMAWRMAAGFPLRELLECRIAASRSLRLLLFLERETGRVRIDVFESELDDLR